MRNGFLLRQGKSAKVRPKSVSVDRAAMRDGGSRSRESVRGRRRPGLRGSLRTAGPTRCFLLAVCLTLTMLAGRPARADVRIRNLCRVLGQQENRLQGLGLVVGLDGTGDGGDSMPTINSLAALLRIMGSPVAQARDLRDFDNVAVVLVSATVPATGARQGDRIDCFINSVGAAKSLRGGRLFLCPLLGPNPADTRTYALAEGPVVIEDPEVPTSARIAGGAILEQDIFNLFSLDNAFTLVIDSRHADFHTAAEIAHEINKQLRPLLLTDELGDPVAPLDSPPLARAEGPNHVRVAIPPQYADDPVDFIAQVLDVRIYNPYTKATVQINEKTGTIIISEDVAISPVVVSHKNLTIAAGTAEVVALDPQNEGSTRLKDLVDALNKIKVPAEDRIAIVKELHKSGKLHAWLVTE